MGNNELLFLQLVSMFQMAAMQQMGKLVDPVSNEAVRDLKQAKISIDTLDMLKERTRGNLGDAENEFLEKVLFELHMNYVDEQKRPSEETGDEEEAKSGEKRAKSASSEAEINADEPDADEPGGDEPDADQKTGRGDDQKPRNSPE